MTDSIPSSSHEDRLQQVLSRLRLRSSDHLAGYSHEAGRVGSWDWTFYFHKRWTRPAVPDDRVQQMMVRLVAIPSLLCGCRRGEIVL